MKNKDVMYHIKLSKTDIKNTTLAILTGDPQRVEKIASYLENPKKLTSNREYTSYIGSLDGKDVLVISTGIGGPSTAICVEELAKLGITHFIRVGTSGGMKMDVCAGDIVIATGAIRNEGTSREYLPIEFPAVADFHVTLALKKSAKKLNVRHHIGVVHCKDSFYSQHSPDRMPVSGELEYKWKAWLGGNTLCSEMESAALFTIASSLNLKASTVLLVIWNQEREKAGYKEDSCFDVTLVIKVAIEAAREMLNS